LFTGLIIEDIQLSGVLDEERTFNMLVSRVACIGKLRHKNIGYSGPLSRQLLSFRSLISTVRATLRDLIEVVLAGLLLSGDADRDRKDWTEMGSKYTTFRNSSEEVGSHTLDFPSSTTMTVVLGLQFEPTWMIFSIRTIQRHQRLGPR
jgi:Temperature dependent protein affecting M2 dsRNA replication